ncbi:hypothetical protein CYMTET_19643 [Cymbomonas tetramitiformis]|uniref:Uncharacterized protein n=1 Tax=Cymbomonas tetramitiformis TaxID=36881 RepID=A0AAE0G5P4_9CHLO|nr:hypothetical protein CYMTET_19643 [Cymbomonas tetramitiformis]
MEPAEPSTREQKYLKGTTFVKGLWPYLLVGVLIGVGGSLYNDANSWLVLEREQFFTTSVEDEAPPAPSSLQDEQTGGISERKPLAAEEVVRARENAERNPQVLRGEGRIVFGDDPRRQASVDSARAPAEFPEAAATLSESFEPEDAPVPVERAALLEDAELAVIKDDVTAGAEDVPELQPDPMVEPLLQESQAAKASTGAGPAEAAAEAAPGNSSDDGIRYARFNPETLVEETFEQAMNRGRIKDLEMVLVITSYGWPPRFSLDWINNQPFPAFVSSKVKGKGVHSEPWGNIGQEDATYFRFITMFWDDLPERMVFLHGHNSAWHQERYTVEYMMRNICYKDHMYMSINSPAVIRHPKLGKSNEWSILKKWWPRLYGKELGPFPKSGLYEKCCAQFMVHRDRIKAHPKSFYERQLKEMTDPNKTYLRSMKKQGVHIGFDLVLFYESTWHVMWGEKPKMHMSKYGSCVDKSIEHIKHPTIMNKNRERCMRNVIGCPVPLCKESPSCNAVLEYNKENPFQKPSRN